MSPDAYATALRKSAVRWNAGAVRAFDCGPMRFLQEDPWER